MVGGGTSRKFFTCEYGPDEQVTELHFEKFDAFTPSESTVAPTFKTAIMRAYETHADVDAALLDESLDLAFGIDTMTPRGFIDLSSREGGKLKGHIGSFDLNTRMIGLHSGGHLNTSSLRKLMFCLLDREPVWQGDLVAEAKMDAMFDPSLPLVHLANPTLTSIADLCRETTSNASDVKQTLRFLYPTGKAHVKGIVLDFIGALAKYGITVEEMAKSKDEYNAILGLWAGEDGEAYTADDWPGFADGTGRYPITDVYWDLAYTETYGPMYDALTTLTDITYTWPAEVWTDNTNWMENITKKDLNDMIRNIPMITDEAERQAQFTKLLNILNNEAIFLPLTAKRNLAVQNTRLSGFAFSGLEYGTGRVIAKLTPTSSAPEWQEEARAAGWVPCPAKASRARRALLQLKAPRAVVQDDEL